MGVGAGVGFAGEAEACWPGAVPPLETKTRIISKTIRIVGCMELKERVRARRTLCVGSLTSGYRLLVNRTQWVVLEVQMVNPRFLFVHPLPSP